MSRRTPEKQNNATVKFKILPAYTGRHFKTLDEVLNEKKAHNLLWLEILFNDSINWEKFINHPVVKENYIKAGVWYNNFSILLKIFGIKRKGKLPSKGKLDMKDYRKLIEALYYVH
jgi:hypothetical protein